MSDNLLTRSDGGIQALCSLDSLCLAGLLGCLSAMIAPRVGKMGSICLSPLGVAGPFEIQYKIKSLGSILVQ